MEKKRKQEDKRNRREERKAEQANPTVATDDEALELSDSTDRSDASEVATRDSAIDGV
jgi:hypothetical protein